MVIKDFVKKVIVVNKPIDEAFKIFVDLMKWWPKEYTWSKDTLKKITIEPFKGGRCIEKGPYNFECDWGRVIDWEPPNALVFTWQISPERIPEPNPDKASEVEVNFSEEENNRTRIELEHRCFSNHGEGAEKYRAALDSDIGWKFILKCYADYANSVEET